MDSAELLGILPAILSGILVQLPVYLVQLVGLGLAAANHGRYPRAARLAGLALVISLIVSVIGQGVNILIPATLIRQGMSASEIGLSLAGLNVGFGLIHAIVWGLMLAAVFNRERPQA